MEFEKTKAPPPRVLLGFPGIVLMLRVTCWVSFSALGENAWRRFLYLSLAESIISLLQSLSSLWTLFVSFTCPPTFALLLEHMGLEENTIFNGTFRCKCRFLAVLSSLASPPPRLLPPPACPLLAWAVNHRLYTPFIPL